MGNQGGPVVSFITASGGACRILTKACQTSGWRMLRKASAKAAFNDHSNSPLFRRSYQRPTVPIGYGLRPSLHIQRPSAQSHLGFSLFELSSPHGPSLHWHGRQHWALCRRSPHDVGLVHALPRPPPHRSNLTLASHDFCARTSPPHAHPCSTSSGASPSTTTRAGPPVQVLGDVRPC